MATIHGVLGPVDTRDLGFTLMHEHILVANWAMRQSFPGWLDRDAHRRFATRGALAAQERGGGGEDGGSPANHPGARHRRDPRGGRARADAGDRGDGPLLDGGALAPGLGGGQARRVAPTRPDARDPGDERQGGDHQVRDGPPGRDAAQPEAPPGGGAPAPRHGRPHLDAHVGGAPHRPRAAGRLRGGGHGPRSHRGRPLRRHRGRGAPRGDHASREHDRHGPLRRGHDPPHGEARGDDRGALPARLGRAHGALPRRLLPHRLVPEGDDPQPGAALELPPHPRRRDPGAAQGGRGRGARPPDDRGEPAPDLRAAGSVLSVVTRPLRVGILGAARIAPMALVRPARAVPEVEIVAVAARERPPAPAFARKHGIPRTCASYDEVIRDADLDAVYNPLPNSLHCEWTIRALEAGKHVLCEKPLPANADEAARMAETAEKTGLVLMEAFHWRYHPLAARMQEIVASGELGLIEHVEASMCIPLILPGDIRYRLDLAGGALMDAGCYAVSGVRFLAGAG